MSYFRLRCPVALGNCALQADGDDHPERRVTCESCHVADTLLSFALVNRNVQRLGRARHAVTAMKDAS